MCAVFNLHVVVHIATLVNYHSFSVDRLHNAVFHSLTPDACFIDVTLARKLSLSPELPCVRLYLYRTWHPAFLAKPTLPSICERQVLRPYWQPDSVSRLSRKLHFPTHYVRQGQRQQSSGTGRVQIKKNYKKKIFVKFSPTHTHILFSDDNFDGHVYYTVVPLHYHNRGFQE